MAERQASEDEEDDSDESEGADLQFHAEAQE